jgi:hypothetical protein
MGLVKGWPSTEFVVLLFSLTLAVTPETAKSLLECRLYAVIATTIPLTGGAATTYRSKNR